MRFQIIFPKWPKLEGQTPFELPSLGPIQAAACVPEGVEVGVTNENVEPIDFDADVDLVGVSMLLTCQTPRGYEVAEEFRARGKTVILGGLAVALHVDEAVTHADAVVVGEAEGLLPRAIEDFRAGRLRKVYRHEAFPDIAAIPEPRRDLYDKKRHYSHKGWELVDLVQTSRGCRFECYPCCTPYLGGLQHRIRPMEHTLADIGSCSDLVFLVDNSLEQNVEYEKELFRAMRGLGKRWISHPVTPTPEVLRLARDSGCWYVYHAIYTVSEKIRDRIKLYHDHGIGVEGTILLGLDDHTEDSIRRLIDFLLTIDLDLAEFTVLTPFPHTQAWNELEAAGRIFDRDWRKYNAGHVVFQPAKMSPETLQDLYYQAWDAFYGKESQTLKISKLFIDVMRQRRARERAAASPGVRA
jgi:radical SAM superfamily enzyme YgiQ (UPF0313 family)